MTGGGPGRGAGVGQTGGVTDAQQLGWTPSALARGAVAVVDLDAFRDNVARCAEAAPSAEVMAVVKADAYGHGLVACGTAALEAGATWLGVALMEEAIALREAGVGGRVVAWLATPGAPWAACLVRDVDVSVSTRWALDEVVLAAQATDVRARVHLKVDTGLSRSGATPPDWPDLVAAARRAEAEGYVQVVGVWSHLAHADAPGHPTIARQLDVFAQAGETATAAGLVPEVRHIANSAATLSLPAAHFELVRPGVALYGLTPGADLGSAADLGLRPVMSLRARLASVKRVPAGTGVAYGHDFVTTSETVLGLVPLGYADGIPRAAVNAGPVQAAGARRRIAGRVSMDQLVIDLGTDEAHEGEEVVLFGEDGPSADDWAEVCGTIGYEIVTRIGPRVPRVHRGVRS